MNRPDSRFFISPEQHGYVKGRSCQSNMLSCMENWTRAVDEDDSVGIIYFDYEKAFEKVPHRLLLKKLKWYGIDGKVWEWPWESITRRVRRVKIKNAKSLWRSVLSSVVQGSVLGVRLFVMYINNLPVRCQNKPKTSPPTPAAATLLLPSNQAHGSWLHSASQLRVNVSSSKTIPSTPVTTTPILYSNRSNGSQLHSASQQSVDVSYSHPPPPL
jgi:hypothetical protein